MRAGRLVVIGWALLVVGGWAATLWLGEPSATAGPGTAPTAVSPGENPGPGPQPEGGPCDAARAAPSYSASATPSKEEVPDGYSYGRVEQRDCATYVIRDQAWAR
ncbi:hypothetical protein AB0G71_25990 [Streptomyces sp. NPDC020403]|uniref:hypothetical protein n=1 Tax=unclassified Streptomyces TaxID=2593676 RepID=UPI0033F8578D